jgi:hypothetical protein
MIASVPPSDLPTATPEPVANEEANAHGDTVRNLQALKAESARLAAQLLEIGPADYARCW